MNDLDRAERYYLTLFEAPGAIPALLHGMVRLSPSLEPDFPLAKLTTLPYAGRGMPARSECQACKVERNQSFL